MSKTRNGGQWTEARFQSFIKSALRNASLRWPPKYEALSKAFVGVKVNEKTGRKAKHFECVMCVGHYPQKEVEVNHKLPVVPVEGFSSWDEIIERMFCEKEGLEVLCKSCHKMITKDENEQRKEYSRKRKETSGV